MKTNFKHIARFKHNNVYIDIHYNFEESDEIKRVLKNYLRSIPKRKLKTSLKLQNYLYKTIEKHGGARVQPEIAYGGNTLYASAFAGTLKTCALKEVTNILIDNPNKFFAYIHDKYNIDKNSHMLPTKTDLLEFLTQEEGN